MDKPQTAAPADPAAAGISPKHLCGPQARALQLERAGAAVDDQARTIALAFSSEEPYERWFGVEILSHSAGAIRTGRLANRGALLMDHNTRDQIGVVESVSIDSQQRVGRAVVRFGKSARAEEIFQDVKDGIRAHVSVGYMVHRWEVQEGKADAPSTYTALDWEPLEVSIVSVPADPTVGVGRGLTAEQAEHLSRSFGFVGAAEQSPQSDPNPAAPQPTRAAQTVTPKGPEVDKTPEQIAAESAQGARAALIKEQQAIIALGEQYRHLGGESIAAAYLREGKSNVSEFQAALLAKVGTRGNDVSKGLIDMSGRELQQYSLVRAINALANPGDAAARAAAAFEFEASAAARAKSAGTRAAAANSLTIPLDVLTGGQRDLTVGTATAGGHTVATNLLAASFIEMLRKKSVLMRAGATTLNGLVGQIAIPRQTGGATAYWVAESGAPTESAQAFDQVSMSPKTVGAFTDISRKLVLQSSIDVEGFVRRDLATVLALEIDRAGLYGSGSSNQPTGVKLATGVNTVDFAANTPTWAEIVSLETEISSDDADVETMAYLVNAAGRGALKTADKASGAAQFIWEVGNTVNGYRALVSNQVASNDYWLGNWADLIMGFWSGLDLMVDPYTGSTSGTIRVVALQDVDVAVRHGESFCRGNNVL